MPRAFLEAVLILCFYLKCCFSSQTHLWEVSDVFCVSVKSALDPLRLYWEKCIFKLTQFVPDKEQGFVTHPHAQTILHHILHSSQFMISAVNAHYTCGLSLVWNTLYVCFDVTTALRNPNHSPPLTAIINYNYRFCITKPMSSLTYSLFMHFWTWWSKETPLHSIF